LGLSKTLEGYLGILFWLFEKRFRRTCLLVRFFCGPLWKEVDASNHEYEEDPRCHKSAQVESAMVVRLIEEIAQNSTKGAREDEGCPEEENP